MTAHTIGGATLHLGDCREILPSLPKSDAVVTDPPYGIAHLGGKWGKKKELAWDKDAAANEGQLIAAGEIVVIWGGNYLRLPPSRGWLVWRKPDRVPSAADVELAWTNVDMNARLIEHSIAATNAERVGHPTQKPERVMRWCMDVAGVKQGSVVLDPYMGSGTTGVAAMQLGHKFVGIEREPKYFDIACRRIDDAQRQSRMFA